MSRRICERCKSENVIEDAYYGGTQYYLCESCLCRGDEEAFPKKTLFHQIAISPEVMAEEMVFCIYDDWVSWWTSNILDKYYNSRAEAITATVAKLKEVVE